MQNNRAELIRRANDWLNDYPDPCPLLAAPDLIADMKAELERGEKEIYAGIHINFLRLSNLPDGLNLLEKYLRYRSAGKSHNEADELMKRPYEETTPNKGNDE